jgi:hypothetical protein
MASDVSSRMRLEAGVFVEIEETHDSGLKGGCSQVY